MQVERRLTREARARLEALGRTLGTLGPAQVLARGYAVVRDGAGAVVTQAAVGGDGGGAGGRVRRRAGEGAAGAAAGAQGGGAGAGDAAVAGQAPGAVARQLPTSGPGQSSGVVSLAARSRTKPVSAPFSTRAAAKPPGRGEEAPALRAVAVLVGEADLVALVPPAALLAAAVGEAPEHAAAGEILLGAEGLAEVAEVQGAAGGGGLEGLRGHRRLGRGGGGEEGEREGACEGEAAHGGSLAAARGPVLVAGGSRRGTTMDVFAEMKAQVRAAIEALAAEGRLPRGLDLGAVTVEPPRDPGHGDMATNAAMVLARPARMAPRDIAEALAGKLGGGAGGGLGRGGGAGLPEPAARSGALVRGGAGGAGGRDATSGGRSSGPGGGSTSSSCRRTRPGRCTSGTRAGRCSATRSPGCSGSPGGR